MCLQSTEGRHRHEILASILEILGSIEEKLLRSPITTQHQPEPSTSPHPKNASNINSTTAEYANGQPLSNPTADSVQSEKKGDEQHPPSKQEHYAKTEDIPDVSIAPTPDITIGDILTQSTEETNSSTNDWTTSTKKTSNAYLKDSDQTTEIEMHQKKQNNTSPIGERPTHKFTFKKDPPKDSQHASSIFKFDHCYKKDCKNIYCNSHRRY